MDAGVCVGAMSFGPSKNFEKSEMKEIRDGRRGVEKKLEVVVIRDEVDTMVCFEEPKHAFYCDHDGLSFLLNDWQTEFGIAEVA